MLVLGRVGSLYSAKAVSVSAQKVTTKTMWHNTLPSVGREWVIDREIDVKKTYILEMKHLCF